MKRRSLQIVILLVVAVGSLMLIRPRDPSRVRPDDAQPADLGSGPDGQVNRQANGDSGAASRSPGAGAKPALSDREIDHAAIGRINDEFAQRYLEMREAFRATNSLRYFEGTRGGIGARKVREWKNLIGALEKERIEALHQVLGRELSGIDGKASSWSNDPTPSDNRMGTIREELQNEVAAGEQALHDALKEGSQGGGSLSQAQLDDMVKREHELVDRLSKILTPSELLDYQLRNSFTSSRLREELTYFNPTEAEYSRIFGLKSEFDAKYDPRLQGLADPVDRLLDETRLNASIKRELGEDRYLEYRKATSHVYSSSALFAESSGLPLDVADRLYGIASGIDSNQIDHAGLEDAQRRAMEVLGPLDYERYRRSSAGEWLDGRPLRSGRVRSGVFIKP